MTMFFIRYVRKALKALSADVAPSEIAAGVTLGALVGLCPFNLFNLLCLLLVVVLFRINVAMLCVAAVVFSALAYLAAPLLHSAGKSLLLAHSLQPFWGFLASLPLVPLTSFNHTLMMGGFVVWVVLALPLFFAARKGVVLFREKLSEKVKKGRVGLILRIVGWLGILRR